MVNRSQLQLQTAPVLLYFPPTVGPNAKPDGQPARLDFLGPQTADSVRNWLLRQLPPGDYPAISRPINYARIGATITILLGVFTFMTVAYPYVLPIIQNRNLWAGISLILILLFTSGHMFNHIRRVPYVAGNGRGGITYFAPGFQNQYGMETQIVAAMCKSKMVSVNRFDLLISDRCLACICYYQPGHSSAAYQRPSHSAISRHYLGNCSFWNVQLPHERVSDQEWRLSVLATTVLDTEQKLRYRHLGTVWVM